MPTCRALLFATITGCVLLLPCTAPAEETAPPVASTATQYKAVIQASDGEPQKWRQILNNIKNLQEAFGKDGIELKLVVYGQGIGMLKLGSEVANRLNETIATGVQVYACENTMKLQNLAKADMSPGISYVHAGIAEIIKLQRAGYAYIKP